MSTSSSQPAHEFAGTAETCPLAGSDVEPQAVRKQLERLLADPSFSSSKRYPRLLQYVVEETLAGRAGQLKERTLGVEVFGRGPDYDTDRDPVVRTSAAQVRQRVAQYYDRPEHHSELRIEFIPGSYVPHFSCQGSAAGDSPEEIAPEAPVKEQLLQIAVDSGPSAWPKSRVPRPRWIGIAVACALAGAALVWWSAARSPVERFWGPVWDKANPAVICVPGKFPTRASVAAATGDYTRTEPLTIRESLRMNSIAWPDAAALYALVGFLEKHGQAYHVRRAGDSTLPDLRSGPSILIGGLNNPWLMKLNSGCRYSYANDVDTGRAWIQDAQHPERQDWQVTWTGPYGGFDEDYGIVSRVWDTTTERIVVTASGIASYGTIAAGDFLSNPKYLSMIAEKAPAGWERKNLQVVFSTKVFNGNAGPPRIVAIHVW